VYGKAAGHEANPKDWQRRHGQAPQIGGELGQIAVRVIVPRNSEFFAVQMLEERQ